MQHHIEQMETFTGRRLSNYLDGHFMEMTCRILTATIKSPWKHETNLEERLLRFSLQELDRESWLFVPPKTISTAGISAICKIQIYVMLSQSF